MYPVIRMGNLALPIYGIIALIAFLFTYWLIKFYALKENFDYQRARDMYLYSAAAGLIGSKVLGIVTDLRLIASDPKQLKTIIISGGVFYGGLLTGVLFCVLYCHYKKIILLQFLDIISPMLVLSISISRLGCFASGCCFGRPTNVAWAVTFSDPIAHRMHPDLPYVPLHPVQLYLSVADLINFAILTLFFARKKFHGQIFFLYLLIYGIGRFFIEYYRFDYRGVLLGGYLSTSQFIAISTSILSLIAVIYLSYRAKKSKPQSSL